MACRDSGESDDESVSSDESYSDDDEEPILKYKRFAKEVVQSTCDGTEGSRDVINCIAVHPKVLLSFRKEYAINVLLFSLLP